MEKKDVTKLKRKIWELRSEINAGIQNKQEELAMLLQEEAQYMKLESSKPYPVPEHNPY